MRQSSRAFLAFVGILLSLTLAACGGKAAPTAEPTPSVEETPIQWAPAGFTQYDENLAYKFTTQQGEWPCQNCNFWKVTVVANNECPNGVYGELNMLDASDTVVDWSNDTVPYLGAGQKALLTFEHYPYDDSYENGQITQLSCN